MPLTLKRGRVSAILEQHDELGLVEVDGTPCVAYAVPAAMNVAMLPASLIPSWKNWPFVASRYDVIVPLSTGS